MKFKKNWVQSDEDFIKNATSPPLRHELLIKLNLQRSNSSTSEIICFIFAALYILTTLIWRDTQFPVVLVTLLIAAIAANTRKESIDAKIKALKLFEKCQNEQTI